MAERRDRENAAARLRDFAPDLSTLSFEIEETRGGQPIAEAKYLRRIVVESAPALFDFHCADHGCEDGGHDFTRAVLDAIRTRSIRFQGEHACQGHVRNAPCQRVLRFVAQAAYAGPARAEGTG